MVANHSHPFEMLTKIIQEQRIDPITFPVSIKAISLHLDTVIVENGVCDESDKFYFHLLPLINSENDEISKQTFLYIEKATPYIKDKAKLLDYIDEHSEMLLTTNYQKNISLILHVLNVIFLCDKQSVINMAKKNFTMLFNMEQAMQNEVIGSRIKHFIHLCCNENNSFVNILIDHIHKLATELNNNDEKFKFIIFVDQLLDNFENMHIYNNNSHLQSIIYNFSCEILTDTNDSLLQCALCNFFQSKTSMDIYYLDKLFPNQSIIPNMIDFLQSRPISQPFDMEMLTLVCYLSKVKGYSFMKTYHIDTLFIRIIKENYLTSSNTECVVRSYFDMLSNYDIFMQLTSSSADNNIKEMNENLMKLISTHINSDSNGIGYITIIKKLTSFFSQHIHIDDVVSRSDYHDFVLRKHKFYLFFLEKQCNYIVKNTFEALDDKYQEVGLLFIDSLLNYSWGLAVVADSSDLLTYLIQHKACLNTTCQSLKMKIIKKIVQNNTFMSVIDKSIQNKLIAISKNTPIKSTPQIASCTR